MYQYNSIMSAVNDFIDEVNESDSNAKLIKPHTIKEAYELLAGYYGKETGKALLEEYESGRPHDVADATKLLLDVLKNKESESNASIVYYITDGNDIHANDQMIGDDQENYFKVPSDIILVSLRNTFSDMGRHIVVLMSNNSFSAETYYIRSNGYIGQDSNFSKTSKATTLGSDEVNYIVFQWDSPKCSNILLNSYQIGNDNASDTAGVLSLARYYYLNGKQISLPN